MSKATHHAALEFRQTGDDTPLTPKQGGLIVTLKAAASLNVGDVVYMSANNTVNKSATSATFTGKIVGVVVGGKQVTPFTASESAIASGLVAANTNEEVYICYSGVAYVVTGAAIAVGTTVVPSTTTAGRVIAGASLTIASGAVAVTSSAANGAIISGDGFGRIVGNLLEASSGSPDAALCLINLK